MATWILRGHFNNYRVTGEYLLLEEELKSLLVYHVGAGDASNNIHFEGYQVSNQCMALVRDDCLIPTRDAPELGYVKESSSTQYVPDVFFKVCKLLPLLCVDQFNL